MRSESASTGGKPAGMLATSAIMANEVFVTGIQPLAPGDEPYALSFVVPMNAPGLKILSRKSYEAESNSVFDNPLANLWYVALPVLSLSLHQTAYLYRVARNEFVATLQEDYIECWSGLRKHFDPTSREPK